MKAQISKVEFKVIFNVKELIKLKKMNEEEYKKWDNLCNEIMKIKDLETLEDLDCILENTLIDLEEEEGSNENYNYFYLSCNYKDYKNIIIKIKNILRKYKIFGQVK